MPNNTSIGTDDKENKIFVSVGEQYTKQHLKAVMRTVIERLIWPMAKGPDSDRQSDNTMVYDDDNETQFASEIDEEKLTIRTYVAGLCMLLGYDNPKVPELPIVRGQPVKYTNFLTQKRRRELVNHFYVETARVDNDSQNITINSFTAEEVYAVHRDVAVYMTLRRIGLAGNEQKKLDADRQLRKTDPENDRLLTGDDINLLETRIQDDITFLRDDLNNAIQRTTSRDLGGFYKKDLSTMRSLYDIMRSVKVVGE